jgi:hypothetical protein
MYHKLDNILPFQDRLKQLVEFNQGLVYGFDPESAPRHSLGSTKWEDTLFPSAGQYEDMLSAYLFAQRVLLPEFKKMNEGQFNAEILVNSIKQLHGFIGKTLMELHEVKSGEYTQQQVMRWNPDTQTDNFIFFIISEKTHSMLEGQNPTDLLVVLLKDELNIDKEQTLQFIDLLKRLKNDPSIKISPSQEHYVADDPSVLAKAKLCVAYLTNKLTQDEKTLVKKIVSICMDPQDIPQAMADYAKETIIQWQACDKQDKKAVAEFLAEMFYQLTEIHPFGNANGRTATCLMNIFLRSINMPSILMRNPGERDMSYSSYCMAFACINETRKPLAEHIYQRIASAQLFPFSDEKRSETTALRCNVVKQLIQVKNKHPQIDINKYQNSLLQVSLLPEYKKLTGIEDQSIFVLRVMLQIITAEENRLDQFVKKIEMPKANFIGTTTLNAEAKEQLKRNLSSLTKAEGWKINPKNNLETWIEIPNIAEAERIAELLKTTRIGTVAVMKRSDTLIPVVKCSNINLTVLDSEIKLIGAQDTVNQHQKM